MGSHIADSFCRVCRGGVRRHRGFFGTKAKFKYLVCTNCSFSFSIDPISDEILSEFYDNYYTAENLVIPNHIKQRISTIVSTFSSFRTEVNAICDFGYGAGTLLEIAQENGWECSGSEYSPDAIEIGKRKGWNVHEGDLGAEDLSGPFDVVAIVETLEHVQDPVDLIQKASMRLRNGGLLYGTTPNGMSFNSMLLGEDWSVFSVPEHPILLSKKSLEILLSTNGFTQIEIHATGFNPHDMISRIKKILGRNQLYEVGTNSRVQSGYELVEFFSRNKMLVFIKSSINVFFSTFGIGDTLVFRAVKYDS